MSTKKKTLPTGVILAATSLTAWKSTSPTKRYLMKPPREKVAKRRQQAEGKRQQAVGSRSDRRHAIGGGDKVYTHVAMHVVSAAGIYTGAAISPALCIDA